MRLMYMYPLTLSQPFPCLLGPICSVYLQRGTSLFFVEMFFAFVRELLFRHISVCKEWFSLKCKKQVWIVFSESRYQQTWFSILIQFAQHTKAPVASNSSAVKHVTHFKWNLCLHLLHWTQGVWSVSKYTNKWLSMSLNWNSNRIPALALIRQIAQVTCTPNQVIHGQDQANLNSSEKHTHTHRFMVGSV